MELPLSCLSDIGNLHLFSFCFVSLARDLPIFFVFSENWLFVSLLLSIVFLFSILLSYLFSLLLASVSAASFCFVRGRRWGPASLLPGGVEVQVPHLRGDYASVLQGRDGCSPLTLQGWELARR